MEGLTPRIPASTYRLQFNHTFGFSKAKKLVPYLYELGITDVYSSPYFKARKKSLHGYDIVDPNTLNPEVGTAEEYEKFVRGLKKYEMGQIIDIIPNHMCNESDNPWWMDVLENGRSSPYSDFFDIDWTPAIRKLNGRLLIPFLGDQYGKALERQELRLVYEEGSFIIRYFDNKFPILPETYAVILEHRIEELKNLFSEDDPHVVELLSIITALKHLPSHTEKDPGRVSERYREKEIVKKRLFALCNESTGIKTFIDDNVGIYNGVKDDPKSFNLLDGLLNEQVWRLSYWRVATDEINYRRFFDINSIAAIHMEDPRVFRESHKLIFRLVSEGKVTGLRVDHADGLYNPSEYLGILQRSCFIRTTPSSSGRDNVTSGDEQSDIEASAGRRYDEILLSDPGYKPFYIIAEKILTRGEKIPEDWPVFGTTGYAFLNSLNGIFVETRNANLFDKLYAGFTKEKINFQDLLYEKKKLVMQATMSGEISTLGNYLDTLSEKNRNTMDFTLNSLTRAIMEVIAFFPVYRTYIRTVNVNDRDRQYIESAITKARRKNPAISSSVFDFLRDVLLLRFPEDSLAEDKADWLDFVMKFQQITGPVMAKGLEDTTFYVYNRLVSLNEVGGSPDRFGSALEVFHGQNIERNKNWAHTLVATSTHDTKRSEDVRARVNVLSEVPEKWKACVIKWGRLNKKKKVAVEGQVVPDRNEEYLTYQTLVGAWPAGPMSDTEYGVFKNRIREYMMKAIREAKVNTSWISPNSVYEGAVLSFVDAIMADTSGNLFLRDFIPFQRQISYYGMLNSLSQTLLKIASPGVPDFYQGTELWDFSLVDPDNRRPVDYDKRMKLLNELKSAELSDGPLRLALELTGRIDEGRVKLYLIYKALNFRKENRELFDSGEYVPLEAAGEKAYYVCSFARRTENSAVFAVAPRFFTQLMPAPEGSLVGKEVWQDSRIIVPFEEVGVPFRNIFTGEILKTTGRDGAAVLYLSDVLLNFPVALMARDKGN